MLSRHWLPIIALGGCLAAGLAYAQPAGDDSRTQASTQERNAQPKEQLEPALSNIKESIDGVARALESSQNEPESPEEKQRADDDLKAQEDMAYWARLMFFATAAGALLTGMGVWLIWRTLVYTRRTLTEARKTTNAARASIDIAKKNSVAQLRAYVSVVRLPGEDGRAGFDNVHRFHAKLSIQNFGSTPAYNLRHWQKTLVLNNADLPDQKWIYDEPLNKDYVLGPNQSIGIAIVVEDSSAELPQTISIQNFDLIVNKQAMIWAYGVVKYEDAFGETRETKFRFFFGHFEFRDGHIGLANEGNSAT